MTDITWIVQAVLGLLAAVITTVIIPYIRRRTSGAQQDELEAWIRIAVSAAEQIYTGPGRGAEKKAYVQQWLAVRGVTVDGTVLDAMIESAVYALKAGVLAGGGN